MSQEESEEILKRINELVIEAAHKDVPESKIMRAVYDGLDLVLGPPDDEWDDDDLLEEDEDHAEE